MKGKKDNKIIISYNLPKNSLGDKSFDDIAEILRRRFIDVVLPSDDTIDRPVNNDSLPPQKEADENNSAYFNRLRKLWGKVFQVEETHQRWKAKHLNGVQERDLKRRIFIQLRELLKSGFLRNDYIETGMPDEDCKKAKEWLIHEGWAGLLGSHRACHRVTSPPLHQDRILCLMLIAGHFVTITKHPNPDVT